MNSKFLIIFNQSIFVLSFFSFWNQKLLDQKKIMNFQKKLKLPLPHCCNLDHSCHVQLQIHLFLFSQQKKNFVINKNSQRKNKSFDFFWSVFFFLIDLKQIREYTNWFEMHSIKTNQLIFCFLKMFLNKMSFLIFFQYFPDNWKKIKWLKSKD